MLTLLPEVEKLLPALLDEPDSWAGLFVDYHHPYVERLWTQWGDNQISLHKIYPCQREDSLFHPHPWPQAVKILKGDMKWALAMAKIQRNHHQ